MKHQPRILLGAVVLLVAVAAVTAVVVVHQDSARAAALDRQARHERDRDAVLKDVHEEEHQLAALKASIGYSAVPKRRDPIEAPDGVEESIFTGKLAIGDFHDVFVDEGVVLTGIRAREVKEIVRRDQDTYPPKPQKPLKADPGYRLLEVDLLVTNRTGDGADPACGISSDFNSAAITDAGTRGVVLESYSNVDTYRGACGDGLADGSSGRIALGVGLRAGDKLKALQFSFLGEHKSDQYTQVLVFHDPV